MAIPIIGDNDALAPPAQLASMGIGLLAQVEIKRKFRFIFGVQFGNNKTVPPHFVKSASRPDITIEDTPIDFLQETTWIPGKAKWETIEVVYYDVADIAATQLYNWLAAVYDFTEPTRYMSCDYRGTAAVVMLDGCGRPLEQWTMANAWPSAIKFGEVSYDSSDPCEVTLTLRYSQVSYESLCPVFTPASDCTSCCTTS